MKPILVLDDDMQIRIALREVISRLGYIAILSESGDDALRKMDQTDVAMAITDMVMPKMDGITFLREVRRRFGNIPVLVITGFGTIENSVEAMKLGAVDYLVKPFSYDKLRDVISVIMERISSENEMITSNPAMQKIVKLSASLAASDITVLIYGESGTGKEVLARSIHRRSNRSGKRFVAVNCAAIPENLLESELFGHEKGAFTGATEKKPGKFELAQGGTILLDEIGEMSLILQAKLLRVLQEREIDRIGSRFPVPIDVRVIATTNRDLRKQCAEGKFREDLFYRLNVFPVHLLPLRERPEDIPVLAGYFLEKFRTLAGKPITGFSPGAMQALKCRPWQGNVRELQSTVQRAVFICSNDLIETEDFLFQDDAPSGASEEGVQASDSSLREIEREKIIRTLKEVNGNKTKAARILGVTPRTIRNKLKAYGLHLADDEEKDD